MKPIQNLLIVSATLIGLAGGISYARPVEASTKYAIESPILKTIDNYAVDDTLKDNILKNNERLDKNFLKEYESLEDRISDRRDENGQPVSVKDFIRPQETSYLIKTLQLDNLSLRQKTEKIHSYVCKNFLFTPDEEGEDLWQYPKETIKRGKGDCEDMAFLLASMLIEAGIPEEMIWVNMKNWHLYTTVTINNKTLVLETDPDRSHFYLYDWPQCRWNRQTIEQRKRKL